MRISDWSSDVCSSDLFVGFGARLGGANFRIGQQCRSTESTTFFDRACHVFVPPIRRMGANGYGRSRPNWSAKCQISGEKSRSRWTSRSEEHTSELQSLMRISYAVFWLKQKKESIH